MQLDLLPAASDARIELRAGGMLKALAHDRAVVADLPDVTLDVSDGVERFRCPVDLVIPVAGLAPTGDDLKDKERADFMANMLGPKVLDAERHPELAFHGSYEGDFTAGLLTGDLVVRGTPRPVAMDVAVRRDGEELVASGRWEGTLADLGIRPFKVLLGAIKLEDWAAIGLTCRFRPSG